MFETSGNPLEKISWKESRPEITEPRSNSSNTSVSSAVACWKLTLPVRDPTVRAQIRVITAMVQA